MEVIAGYVLMCWWVLPLIWALFMPIPCKECGDRFYRMRAFHPSGAHKYDCLNCGKFDCTWI